MARRSSRIEVAVTYAEQHLIRGLAALHALDARLHKDKKFYKLKNRFIEAVARRPETQVQEHVDSDEASWLVVSSSSYVFRIPGRVASKELRARASFALKAPEMMPSPEGDVDVDVELRALDDASRVLNGRPPAARVTSADANA